VVILLFNIPNRWNRFLSKPSQGFGLCVAPAYMAKTQVNARYSTKADNDHFVTVTQLSLLGLFPNLFWGWLKTNKKQQQTLLTI